MKKILFFACMILSYSTVSFSGTDYYCTVNEKFPGMVGVYKNEMEDFILLQAVDKDLSIKDLRKVSLTKKNDSDDNNQLSCLFGGRKGKLLNEVFTDHKLKAKFKVIPLKSHYTLCGGSLDDDNDLTIAVKDESKVLTRSDHWVYGERRGVFNFTGEVFICGSSATDPD